MKPASGKPIRKPRTRRAMRSRCASHSAAASGSPAPPASLSESVASGRCSSPLAASIRRRPSDSAGIRSARMAWPIAQASSSTRITRTAACTQPGTIAGRSKSAAARKSPSTPTAAANSGQQRSQKTAARAAPTRQESSRPDGDCLGVTGPISGMEGPFTNGVTPNAPGSPCANFGFGRDSREPGRDSVLPQQLLIARPGPDHREFLIMNKHFRHQ
jgi:hypothetical protein